MKKVSSLLELGFANDIHRTLFCPIDHATIPPSSTQRHTKISMISVGNMGMAITWTIPTDELALVDAKLDKLQGGDAK
ncbi:unnamed protein product [Musa acuminata subsp. malaccensis]|uniref:(wild Malaysian banana) hypothetical protein n=1 Tax=Musa acuminata subsp. malaccensis TaxID=214687 RepID=A0A804KGH9_MUSAM|nr:unnamed protein product [Musa acuminata subsp. malaccensis]